MPQVASPEQTAYSPILVAQPHEPVSKLTIAEKLLSLHRMSARLAYLADEARMKCRHDLEAALIKTAADVLTSSKEIAAAQYAASFIHKLTEVLERIEAGLDDSDSDLPIVAH